MNRGRRTFEFIEVGIIHSQYPGTADVPIQPRFAKASTGTVEVYPEYADGLRDIEGFSHIELIYVFHLAHEHGELQMVRRPFLDEGSHGLFAIRHPVRPNPIGLSVVELVGRKGSELQVSGLDIVDGTPLLDIKPHVPGFSAAGELRLGWMEGKIT